MTAFLTLLRREILLSSMGGGSLLLAISFFVSIVLLLPLAAGSSLDRLPPLAVGMTWVGLSLASLLSLERLFERDLEDGTLDQLALGPLALEWVCLAKCLAQWIGTGAPLAFVAPLVAAMLGARPETLPLLTLCALIASLAFACLGGLGASLALGSRRGGVLIAVVVLPLEIPPLIFGAGAVQSMADGLPWTGGLMLMSAYGLLSLALTPFAMAAGCRAALE